MIKRQFYTLLHPTHNRDDISASSSSSSDSSQLSGQFGSQEDNLPWPASSHESDEPSDGEEIQSSPKVLKSRFKGVTSGHRLDLEVSNFEKQTEPSDANSDLQKNGKKKKKYDEVVANKKKIKDQWKEVVEESVKQKDQDLLEEFVVVRIGRVMKCKLCPQRVMLSEEQMNEHLHSKGHARSLRLFEQGRLKKVLNSDGEVEEEAETHAERHLRTMAVLEESQNQKRKRDGGRQRQRKRAKRKVLLAAGPGKAEKKACAKGRHGKSLRTKRDIVSSEKA